MSHQDVWRGTRFQAKRDGAMTKYVAVKATAVQVLVLTVSGVLAPD